MHLIDYRFARARMHEAHARAARVRRARQAAADHDRVADRVRLRAARLLLRVAHRLEADARGDPVQPRYS